jgi:hypothetical protein
MSENSYIYELSINNLCVFRNSNINFVFHEYLNYLKEDSRHNLIIKKKLNDTSKRFPLYLENITYNIQQKKFISDSQIYSINEVSYLMRLINEEPIQTNVQDKKKEFAKIPINKPNMPKVKVVNFEKENNKDIKDIKEIKEIKEENLEAIDEKIDEEKLKELEEMISKMEELKEQEVEKMQKEKEIVSNKEMEDRKIKMRDRTMKDKRKEINNIFEADRRLYFSFLEIIRELEKLKENEKNNINDNRRISELTPVERKAKVLFGNNEDFIIPELFVHKFPIFSFIDEENIINHEHVLLAFKQIYYRNYETNTESRKYFGEEVYMFNEEDDENYEKYFNVEQRELINNYSNEISNKLIDVEKLINKKIDQNRDIFKQKDFSRIREIDDLSDSDSDDCCNSAVQEVGI